MNTKGPTRMADACGNSRNAAEVPTVPTGHEFTHPQLRRINARCKPFIAKLSQIQRELAEIDIQGADAPATEGDQYFKRAEKVLQDAMNEMSLLILQRDDTGLSEAGQRLDHLGKAIQAVGAEVDRIDLATNKLRAAREMISGAEFPGGAEQAAEALAKGEAGLKRPDPDFAALTEFDSKKAR